MNTPLERAKKRTLKEVTGILRLAYAYAGQNPSNYTSSWRVSQLIKVYSQGDPEREKEIGELFHWGVQNPHELEVYMAGRSPGTVSKWSISWNRRLCPEAEKIVKGKAGDRSTLLDYCSHFGILLDDVSKITMKAAFGENCIREKAYIRKMEHTKKKLKEFLTQMVGNGDVNPCVTVKELMETL